MLLHDLMQELNQHWFSYWLACKAFEIKELSGFFCFSLDLCDNLWRIHISLRGGGCLTWSLIILLLCFFLLRCYVLYISSYLIDDFRLFWSLSLSLFHTFQISIKYINFSRNEVCVWQKLFLSTYFIIQFIFTIIYGSRCIFLVLFMGFTVLFQLTFTFIFSTFNKKISVSAK